MTERGDPKVSAGAGRDDDTLPVFDAVEPFEADWVRRRPGGARGPGPARGAGIAAGFLVLLVAGIVVGNLEKQRDPGPSSAPTGIHVVAGPTGGSGSCNPQPSRSHPTLSMAVTGVAYAVDALPGGVYESGQEVLITPTWLIPTLARALYVQPQDTFDVGTSARACIKSIGISYKPTASLTPGPGGDGLFQEIFRPPAESITFEGIPLGDWVLRAEAHYQMLGDDPGAEIVTVSYFRVVAGVTPTVTDGPQISPVPTPVATPAVACGPTTVTAATTVMLVGGLGDPIPGAADVIPTPLNIPADVPLVPVGLGNPIWIEIDGAACAVRWDLELLDLGSRQTALIYSQDNPSLDPSFGVQNRWQISTTSDAVLIARLGFANGVSLVRTWQVAIQPFQVPAAFVVAQDGSRFAASAGCGLTIELANGFSSGDDCGSIGYSPTEEALNVKAYQAVTFEIPGWGVRAWSATCGTVVTDQGLESFDTTDGCDLGGGASDTNEALGPIAFVLRPGDTVIRFGVSAVGATGDVFGISYFVRVIAT